MPVCSTAELLVRKTAEGVHHRVEHHATQEEPDVFELIRAKSNKITESASAGDAHHEQSACGYFRDLQIIKEVFLPAFDELKDCLQMAAYIINKIEVNEHILDNPMYDPMFSVEEVNQAGCQRDAVPRRIQEGGS
jgi:argininosuccinate lyase